MAAKAINEDTLYIEPNIMDNVTWEDCCNAGGNFWTCFTCFCLIPITMLLLQKIREREKPLAAYLFTKNKDEKTSLLQLLSFGGGCINDTLMQHY